MKVKEKSENVGLKLNIQKTKIMASSPITSWQIDRETVERVADFILGGSKITADGDCSHEIKRCLLLGRKVMTNLDSIFREGNGNPLQYSPGKSHGRRTLLGCSPWGPYECLSGFTFTFHFHALEKEMATHTSILAWKIPWTEDPGRLQSMGSQRVRHD